MVPVVEVDLAPTTAFATEASTLSPGPTSTSDQGLETPPTVSDHAMLTIVVAN